MSKSSGRAMRSGIVFVCIALTLSALTVSSFANAFRNPPSSASALAVDGAKSVMISDASAISVNPARLTSLNGPSTTISLTFINGESTFTSPLGFSADTQNNLKYLPNFYAAMPITESGIVFGLGITTPYGQSVEWKKSSGLPYFSEMMLVDISPTLACKLSDSISAGVGLDIYVSQLHLKQLMPWAIVTGVPGTPTGSASMKGDGTALGVTIGIAIDITEHQRVGLVYHSPFDIEYDGDTKLNTIPPPLAPVVRTTSDFESEIKFPTVASLAYAVDLTDTITVGAEIEYIDFSRFESLPIGLGRNGVLQQGPNGFPTEIAQNWDDIWTYGAAATWKYSETIELRGNYRFLESPIPDVTHAPTLPDADKHLVGIGIGWKSDRHAIDAGYTYSFLDDRDITANNNPMFIGSYDLESHIASVAYSYSL